MDKCVLIVDDNDFNRELVKDILEDEDITVYEAEDGGEALEIALKEKPDIVITDIRMPELSGIDLMKKLNENSIFS